MNDPLCQVNKDYMAEQMVDWILRDIPKPVRVKLFDDVGSIYEIQLAKMELSSWWEDLEEFSRRAAYYEELDGRKTHHYYISDIRGKGQIGRSSQYLTHWYYPYKAKFHPQMIKALMNWMGLKAGDLLLDPFAGSGTALVEARLVGVDSIGVDIDPLCILISAVKTRLLDMDLGNLVDVDLREVFNFFHDHRSTWRPNIPSCIESVESDKKGPLEKLGGEAYEFYLLSYLHALSDWTYVQVDMWKRFNEHINSIVRNLSDFNKLKERLPFHLGRAKVLYGDARRLAEIGIASNSVDGIVTSPPYSIAVDYVAQDLHALRFLGVDTSELQKKLVGLKGKGDERIQFYYKDMILTFKEMFRSLKPGRNCCVIIGDVNYNGERLYLSDVLTGMARKTGFKYLGIIRRPILGGLARLKYEYILFFQKP